MHPLQRLFAELPHAAQAVWVAESTSMSTLSECWQNHVVVLDELDDKEKSSARADVGKVICLL